MYYKYQSLTRVCYQRVVTVPEYIVKILTRQATGAFVSILVVFAQISALQASISGNRCPRNLQAEKLSSQFVHVL